MRVETGRKYESRQGEGCSRHRLYHIADADEERGAERMVSVAVLGDGCRDADVVGLVEAAGLVLGIHRCLNGTSLAATRVRTLEREEEVRSGDERALQATKKRTRPAAHTNPLSPSSGHTALHCLFAILNKRDIPRSRPFSHSHLFRRARSPSFELQ